MKARISHLTDVPGGAACDAQDMDTKHGPAVQIHLDGEAPFAGVIRTGGPGPALAFTGWLGLIAVLERCLVTHVGESRSDGPDERAIG